MVEAPIFLISNFAFLKTKSMAINQKSGTCLKQKQNDKKQNKYGFLLQRKLSMNRVVKDKKK